MNRKTKGRLGEAKVLVYFIEQGYEVYLPLSPGTLQCLFYNSEGELDRDLGSVATGCAANPGGFRVPRLPREKRTVLPMTLSIFNIFSVFHLLYGWVHGWFYHGTHRGYREQEQNPRKEAVIDALILLGAVTCTVLIGLLAVLLAKGW